MMWQDIVIAIIDPELACSGGKKQNSFFDFDPEGVKTKYCHSKEGRKAKMDNIIARIKTILFRLFEWFRHRDLCGNFFIRAAGGY